MAAAESYPDDLLYHPQHDWARIEDGEAVLGITWYAQDALGELVHFEPPQAGATIAKDGVYGEGWLVRIRLTEPSETDGLPDADAYKALLAEQ